MLWADGARRLVGEAGETDTTDPIHLMPGALTSAEIREANLRTGGRVMAQDGAQFRLAPRPPSGRRLTAAAGAFASVSLIALLVSFASLAALVALLTAIGRCPAVAAAVIAAAATFLVLDPSSAVYLLVWPLCRVAFTAATAPARTSPEEFTGEQGGGAPSIRATKSLEAMPAPVQGRTTWSSHQLCMAMRCSVLSLLK